MSANLLIGGVKAMARPRRVTDEQVFEVAREVFLALGPTAPVSMIAGRLCVSDAALFKRFGTKEELLVSAMLPPENLPFLQLLERGPGAEDLLSQLRALAVGIAETLGRMMPRISVLLAAGIDPREALRRFKIPPPVRARRAIAAWLQAAQVDGRLCDDFSPDVAATTLMGAMHFRNFMHSVFMHSEVGSSEGPGAPDMTLSEIRAYAEGVVDLLWAGVAPKEDVS